MSPILIRSLPFGLYIAFLALESGLTGWVHGVDVRGLYPVKTLVVTLALLFLWRRFDELKAYRLSLANVLLAVTTGVAVFVLWINLDSGWMTIGESGAGYRALNADGSLDWVLITFRLAGAAIIVPIMEELFWRSFIQRWIKQPDFTQLDPARVGVRALLVTSALFAVEHHQWFAGLIAGLAYGGLYIYSRNLWVPIIAHAVTNGALGLYVIESRRWQFW
jgi:CAAX prenyl protease-like protein